MGPRADLNVMMKRKSTIKMEAVRFFKMFVIIYQITQYHIPEDNNLHSHPCENLKSLTETSAWNQSVIVPFS
jgi:hypothetical protein